MSLDKNNTDKSYLVGRLYATYERLQQQLGSKDYNFGNKMNNVFSRPSAEFGTIFRIFNAKMTNDLSDVIGEILDKTDCLPKIMTPVEWSQASLGYYHQKALWAKE